MKNDKSIKIGEREREKEREKKHSRFYSFSPAFSTYFCSRLVTLSSIVDVHEISPSLEVLLLSVQIVSSYDLKTKTKTEINGLRNTRRKVEVSREPFE